MKVIKQNLLLIAAFIATVYLLIYPAKVLLADYFFLKARNILYNLDVANTNFAEISGARLLAYREAIESLQKTASLVPARAAYRKSLFDIYLWLGKWSDTMTQLEKTLPAGVISREAAFKNAVENIQMAITLNPLNADYQLAFGKFYRAAARDAQEAARKLGLAAETAPMNAALRYEVALQYLLLGNKNEALNHSRVLAHMDESYRLHSDAALADAPRHDSWYVSRLAESYLFKSMEITWRASGKRADTVRSIVPDNPDAQQVLLLFLEKKGQGE